MKHYTNTNNHKPLRGRVLAILLSVILCITLFPSTAFGATKYITPPKSGPISYTVDVLSGEWSFFKETPTIDTYGGVQIYRHENEKLTLNSDGTFLYNYSSVYFPTNPAYAGKGLSESDSGSYSVSGDKIKFVSSGKLNGTRSVLAQYDKKGNHDLLKMAILHNDLARSGFGKLSEDGHVRPVSFPALYALAVGKINVGFGMFGGTTVEVSKDGSDFVVEMYMGADIVNGEGVSGFAPTDSVKSISANVLQIGKEPVKCKLKMVPLSISGYTNLINYYELRVPKSSLGSKTANFRYIEVILNGKAFLLDTNNGFLSKVPSDNDVLKKTSISKVTVGAKNFKVTWKAVPASQKITKYQVRYKAKGAKKWTTKTVSAKSTKLTVKKLVKGKTYQIQVRWYKTVKSANYYSDWSKVKTSGKIK